jgi:hypothetical protein
MANTLRFKRGLASGIPTAAAGEPLFTTDTFDLYIGNGTTNTRFQKYIASGATTQILRGDGSLYTFPLAISSPSNGQVLKYNGTNWVNDSDAGITGSGSAGQVAYFTGATTQASSVNLFWNSANSTLGIGTNNPTTRLYVTSGSANTTFDSGTLTDARLEFRRAGTRIGYLNWDSGVVTLQADSGNYLGLNAGGSERARIFATGNFGIGTGATDSGEKLQVTGNAKITGSLGIGDTATYFLDIQKNGSNSSVVQRIKNTGTSTNDDALLYFSTQGSRDFSIGLDRSSGLFNFTGGAASVSSNIYLSIDAISGNLGLAVTPSAWSGTNAFQINQGNFRGDAGAVGISHNAFYNGSSFIYQTSTVATDYYQQSGKHVWQTAGSGTAGNAITFTQAMTLDASGNLGLGITIPTQRLHVSGNALFTGYVESNSGVYFSGNVSGPFIWVRDNYSLRFGTNDTERMRLTNLGNLHIGTFSSDSGEKLQVNGTAKITGATTIGGNLTVNSGNNINLQNASANSTLSIYNSGASGSSILNINSTILATNNLNNVYAINSSGANYGFIINESSTSFSLGYGPTLTTKGTAALTWNTSGAVTIASNLTVDTNTLFVDATNNRVGVLTTTPSEPLHVAGNILISGVNSFKMRNLAGTDVNVIRAVSGGTSVLSTATLGNNIAIGTQSAHDFLLCSSDTERIRLSSSGWFSHTTATNPSSSVTDSYVQYSADVTAGNAAPHFRTENGAVIKLYQETTAVGNSTISLGGGNAVLDDTEFDGYTLRQIVKALRNQGILA